VEEAGEDVGTPLVTGSEGAKAGEPDDGALDHPAMTTEARGRLDALASHPDANATAEVGAAAGDVVCLVSVELDRADPRSPSLPSPPTDGGIASIRDSKTRESCRLAAES
jgi:hypothetical protein